jgi:tetratricopeptide (TPR) repeat protein
MNVYDEDLSGLTGGNSNELVSDMMVENAWALFRENKIADAEKICQSGLKKKRFNSDLWSLLGLIQQRQNRHPLAILAFRAALAYGPDLHAVHYSLGVSLRLTGNPKAATTHLRLAHTAKPDVSNYQRELGITLHDIGRPDEAEPLLRDSLEGDQALHVVHLRLGLIAHGRKNFNTAIDHYTEAHRLLPAFKEPLIRKAELLTEIEDFRGALDAYQNLLQSEPGNVRLWLKCASIHFILGGLDQAAHHAKRAIAAEPGNIEGHILLGKILLSQGAFDFAETIFQKALIMQPDDPYSQIAYAVKLERQGNIAGAQQAVDIAIKEIPGHPQLLMLMARIQKTDEGRKDTVNYIEERLNNSVALTGDARAQLHFSTGTLYDQLKDVDAAFKHFSRGNMLRSKARLFDKSGLLLEFEAIKAVFTADFLRSAPKAIKPSSKNMIFIIGMPRSGTSLAEQVLASHSQIYGAGEQLTFGRLMDRWFKPSISLKQDHYRALAKDVDVTNLEDRAEQYINALPEASEDCIFVVDKMPYNFMHIGMISLVFPQAKIIHCTRDPMDTLLSCYFQDFAEGNAFSYDLSNCGWFYQQYESLMLHWQEAVEIPIYNNSYEILVDNPEKEIGNLLEFCGLDYEPSCLDFHRSERVIHTASYQQVREPIYRRSVQKWKTYERYLGPLIEVIGRG